VPNPQSPDRTIPALSGAGFRSEFDTPAKIADVIRSGSVIGRAPIVSMPHWGGILARRDVDALIAYLATLRYRVRGSPSSDPGAHRFARARCPAW
jgi:hypothetical protein